MPDTLEIRTLERKNVKRLSLTPEAKHEEEPAPKTVESSTISSLKEQLDNLEILVDFKLDLIPDDLKLHDLVTMREAPSGMSGQVSFVRHAPSGVVMARRVCSQWPGYRNV
jgi:mitogen-activated protein kinase kinase